KAIDNLSQRIRVAPKLLRDRLRELNTQASRRPASARAAQTEEKPHAIAVSSLDPIDLELIRILLNEPSVVHRLVTRVAPASLRAAPLRAILQACYDVHGEGGIPSFDLVAARLTDPAVRGLASELIAPAEAAPPEPGVNVFAWRKSLA